MRWEKVGVCLSFQVAVDSGTRRSGAGPGGQRVYERSGRGDRRAVVLLCVCACRRLCVWICSATCQAVLCGFGPDSHVFSIYYFRIAGPNKSSRSTRVSSKWQRPLKSVRSFRARWPAASIIIMGGHSLKGSLSGLFTEFKGTRVPVSSGNEDRCCDDQQLKAGAGEMVGRGGTLTRPRSAWSAVITALALPSPLFIPQIVLQGVHRTLESITKRQMASVLFSRPSSEILALPTLSPTPASPMGVLLGVTCL